MKIKARRLLEYSLQELTDMLNGPFTLVFDNGDEIETNDVETLYSRYAWELLREFPETPLKSSQHLTKIMDGSCMGQSHHTKLLGNVFWDVYFTYTNHPTDPEDPVYFREYLAKRIYEINNLIYNRLTIDWGDYITTLKLEDFLEIREFPRIKEILDNPSISEKYIMNAYDVTEEVLIKEPNKAQRENKPELSIAYHNKLSRLVRSGLVNKDQVDQCIIFRGHVSDINSDQFKIPILGSLLEGKQSMYAGAIESRSASKALYATSKPLQRAETYNRFSQLLSQGLKFMIYKDCGSQHFINWKLRSTDLGNMYGVNYWDEEKKEINFITPSDTHLVGRTLKLRTPMGCITPEAGAVCSTCYGQLSHHFFRESNVGMVSTTESNSEKSQKVLSTKHFDKSIIIDLIRITGATPQFFEARSTGDSVRIIKPTDPDEVYLVINQKDAPGFADIKEVDDVRSLSESRTSSIVDVGLEMRFKEMRDRPITSVGEERRRASITHDMMAYIKKRGFEVDRAGNYLINLDKWDESLDAFVVPRRHVNMGDHVAEIAKMIEGRTGEEEKRNSEINIGSYLMELFDMINSKMSINFSVIAASLYTNMVINADPYNEDYNLPKGNTRSGLGIYSATIRKRSLGTTMAHQNQQNILIDPSNFIQTNRLDSPLDVCLDPAAVMARKNDSIPYYS